MRSSKDIYNAVATHIALDMPADREIEEVVIKDFSNGSLEEAAAAEAKSVGNGIPAKLSVADKEWSIET